MEKEKAVNFIIVSVYVFAFLGVCIFLAPIILKIVLPFVLAYFISFMITPLSDVLYERCRVPKRIAIVILMLLFISLIILLIFNFIYQAAFAVQSFSQMLSLFFDGEIPSRAKGLYKFYQSLPTSKQIFIDDILINIKDNVSDIVKSAAAVTFDTAKGIAVAVPKIFIFTAVLLLATYFICVKRKELERAIFGVIPKKAKPYIKMLKRCLKKALGGYVNAQLILMCITFAVLFAAFLILRIKYAFLMAALTAFVDALPIFGSGTVLIPWAAVNLLSGDCLKAVYLFGIYLIVMIIRQLSEPKIVGSRLGTDPLVTLFAMFAGFKLAGILGLILAPVFAVIIKEFNDEKRKFRSI